MLEKIKSFLRNEEGLTIVEYAVAAGLITGAVVITFTTLGGTINTIIGAINTALNA